MRTVHLSVAAIMWAKVSILTDSVLKEGSTVIQLRVDDLPTSPLIMCERGLINMQDLVPGSHEMLLFPFIFQRIYTIANNWLLKSNLALVNGLKRFGDGHFYLSLFNLIL